MTNQFLSNPYGDDMTMPKIRVALVTGGDSSERPVCFMSAKALSLALPPDRFSIAIFDVASAATRAKNPSLGETVLGKKPRHVIEPVAWNSLIGTLYTTGFDVVLPALHGGWGEDGTLQSLLEVAGIPYVGSKQHTSAIAIDKQTCKAVVSQLGVPTPRGEVLWSLADLEAAPRDSFFFHQPCVVKPNSGGSSLGVTLFHEAP
ncbi:MAG: D-alanine-D-alanine ligase, partial [Abditibacteriota bacterium]|nr:D-alanine-D-alanine ligase [Abditibacteriota bacterium]